MSFRICCSNFLLFLVIGNVAAFPQAQITSTDAAKVQEMKLYGNAHPYLDDSQAALREIVPELHNLEPVSSQEELPIVLEGVGAKVADLLRDVPNLVSDETVGEDVSYEEDPYKLLPGHHPVQSANVPDDISPRGSSLVKSTAGVKTFNYIVLVHETGSGRILEEYRTDRKGRPVSQDPETLSSVGFVSKWVVFSPANRNIARFRYLGQQKIGGHNTFVVAFAQTPSRVSNPGTITFPDGRTIPMLSQGVAWIDESNFRILRLRTDLLAPQPQMGLNRLTAMIQFGPVRIEKLDAQLWLPLEVKINLEANGRMVQELHRYNKFRLYKAETKILTDAP
jgi:hypothetical protein